MSRANPNNPTAPGSADRIPTPAPAPPAGAPVPAPAPMPTNPNAPTFDPNAPDPTRPVVTDPATGAPIGAAAEGTTPAPGPAPAPPAGDAGPGVLTGDAGRTPAGTPTAGGPAAPPAGTPGGPGGGRPTPGAPPAIGAGGPGTPIPPGPPPAPGAARPAPPAISRRSAARSPTARPENVSAEQEGNLTAQLRNIIADSLADVLGTGAEALAQYADVLAPLVARQAFLATSDDPAVRARALDHLRHLQSQAIMQAGIHGVDLQQRQEQRVLTVLDVSVNVARRFIVGL